MFRIFGKKSSKKEEKSRQPEKNEPDGRMEKSRSDVENKVEELLNKGVNLLELGKHEEAIKCFDEAIKINPEDADAWNSKGAALLYPGRSEEAIECFERAIRINPEDANAWNNKGGALVKLERYKEAIASYERAIRINPEDETTWNNKGFALLKLERYKEAIASYERAIRINPEDANAWYGKGNALNNLETYEEAIECYEKAIRINPEDANSWDNKGFALLKRERCEEAIECFDKAIKINPEDVDAWNNKGISLVALGRFDEALKCSEQAVKINPNLLNAHILKEAILQQLVSIKTKSPETRKSSESSPVGDFVRQCLRPQYTEVTESRNLQNTPGLRKIADLGNSGKHKDVIREAKILLKKYLDFDFFYLWLGKAYLELNDYKNARSILKEGLNNAKSKSYLCLELGEVEWKSKNAKEALKWWCQSIHCHDSNPHDLDNAPYLYLGAIAGGFGLKDDYNAFIKRAYSIKNASLTYEAMSNLQNLFIHQKTEEMEMVIKKMVELYFKK